jgi:uncharacterized protein YecT (DUF1311 family)
MQWPDMLKDVVLLLLGGIGTAVWFFWRRKAEQAPVFENIQKAEKLLSLRKELDNTNYTVEDLKSLEDALMGRAEVAKKLSITYEQEAQQIREIKMNTAMTQAEMNVVAAQAYRRAERKLEVIIEQMKTFFSPEECAHFDKANQAWRTYQQIHADFAASQYEGGSIQPLIHASALETVTIARIVELETELKFMKATQVPYAEREAF